MREERRRVWKNSSEETEITEGLMIPSPSTQIRPANTPSFTGVCWSGRARSKETGVLALALVQQPQQQEGGDLF